MTTKLTSPKVSFKEEDIKDKGQIDKLNPISEEMENDDSKIRIRKGYKSAAQGEFSGMYDKEGHHLKSDKTPDMRFKENREDFTGKGYEYSNQPGYQSTQSSEVYDYKRDEDQHLKSDGTPDMRYKENRDDYSGKGFENTTSGGARQEYNKGTGTVNQSGASQDKEGHHLKYDGTPDMRYKENRDDYSGKGFEYTSTPSNKYRNKESYDAKKESFSTKKSSSDYVSNYKPNYPRQQRVSPRGDKNKQMSKTPEKSSTRNADQKRTSSQVRAQKSDHLKGDGTPDMRFKGNREEFSDKGYENTTSRPYSSRMSKANMGLYEGNVPGEHSGKYDKVGHHLKNDGTPDMRFKENRFDFSGQGYEYPVNEQGYSRKVAKYHFEEDPSVKNIYYHRRRPPTPYALYIKENASEMKKENPELDMNEVFRELGKQWQSSSLDYKKKYYDMYEKEYKKYEELGQHTHRGPLSMRKFAEQKGLKTKDLFENRYGSKKGKTSKNYLDTQETNEEENRNFNYGRYTGITA